MQEKLLEDQVSHLVYDMVRIEETIQTGLEVSVEAFLEHEKHPRAAKPLVRRIAMQYCTNLAAFILQAGAYLGGTLSGSSGDCGFNQRVDLNPRHVVFGFEQ